MYVYIGIYKKVEIKEWIYKKIKLEVILYIQIQTGRYIQAYRYKNAQI